MEGDPLPAEPGAEHPQHVVVVRRHEHVLGARLSAHKKIFVKCGKNICYLHHPPDGLRQLLDNRIGTGGAQLHAEISMLSL